MELSTALIIYVVATILLYVFFYNVLRIRGWSSFILAIIAGIIILWCLYPLTAETMATAIITNNHLAQVYVLLWFLTGLLAFIYLVIKAFSDKRGPAPATTTYVVEQVS